MGSCTFRIINDFIVWPPQDCPVLHYSWQNDKKRQVDSSHKTTSRRQSWAIMHNVGFPAWVSWWLQTPAKSHSVDFLSFFSGIDWQEWSFIPARNCKSANGSEENEKHRHKLGQKHPTTLGWLPTGLITIFTLHTQEVWMNVWVFLCHQVLNARGVGCCLCGVHIEDNKHTKSPMQVYIPHSCSKCPQCRLPRENAPWQYTDIGLWSLF